MPDWLKQTTSGITLAIYCQPGAKQTKVVGVHDGYLKISIQAPAVENKANQALLGWLSKKLKVPQKQIQLISGQNSRIKRIEIWSSVQADQIYRILTPK